MDAQILCGRLYVFESGREPVFPAENLHMSKEEQDYCLALMRKTEGADTTAETRFTQYSETAALFDSYAMGEEAEFMDAFARQFIGRVKKSGVESAGFDLMEFFCQEGETLWFCAFSLPYQTALFHRVQGEGVTGLSPLPMLPFAGGRTVAGALVNFSTAQVYLRDQNLRAEGGTRPLLASIALDAEGALSQADSVKAVREAAMRAADAQTPPWEAAPQETPVPPEEREMVRSRRKEQVREALSRSVAQTGALDMEYIAGEIFQDDERVKKRFQQELTSRGVPQVVEIESDRLRASLEKVRFSTDSGIQITLPRQIADDAEQFEIVHNPDGSITIEIKRVQSVKQQ